MCLESLLDVDNVLGVALLGQQPLGDLASQTNEGLIVSLCDEKDGLDGEFQPDTAQFLGQFAHVPSHVGQLTLGQMSRLYNGRGSPSANGLRTQIHDRYCLITGGKGSIIEDGSLVSTVTGLISPRVGVSPGRRNPFPSYEGMDETCGFILIFVDLGFCMVIIGGDEGGFATVIGIGVEDDLELILGISVAGGRPIALAC